MTFAIANAKTNLLAQEEKPNKYCIDDYSIDMHAKNSSHAIVVKNAIGAKHILDVGCGVGYIGHKLKELQSCTVDGIEVDQEAVKVARTVLDTVYHFAVGNHSHAPYLDFLHNDQTYDCIIFADLIEHLVDPGAVIADFSAKLSKNGKMLISIPNVAHLDIIAGLLDGKFNYSNAGILDSTHLRFFTKYSFCEFIHNVNQRYHVSLSVKHLQSTYAENLPLDNGLIGQTFNSREPYIFQNIFELTVSPHYSKTTIKHPHHFSKIISLINDNHHYQQENAQLKAIITQKDQVIQELTSSTSWKLTAPLRKVNAKLHRNIHHEN